MWRRLRDDRGEINFVKIFMLLAVAALGYGAWVYGPLWLDFQGMKKGVRTACNVAYGARAEGPVYDTVLNAYKELEMKDTDLAVDGRIIERPTPFDRSNIKVELLRTPPQVTVEIDYERKLVLPWFKKLRTVRYHYAHTEDLSNIKY